MERWELWKIQGLGESFENTTVIEANDAKVAVSKVRGDADVRREWVLKLSDSGSGLSIDYHEIMEW
jgi:hypothetical protein